MIKTHLLPIPNMHHKNPPTLPIKATKFKFIINIKMKSKKKNLLGPFLYLKDNNDYVDDDDKMIIVL